MELDALIGEWNVEAPLLGDAVGRATFEWLQGGGFVVQRQWVPDTPVPSAVCAIGPVTEGEGRYRQHYFDSRGVIRVYEMTLADGVWKLWREDDPNFLQRWEGQISPDGQTIRGRWEKAMDGGDWEVDFEVIYTRTG
jgi:hypothetical protein